MINNCMMGKECEGLDPGFKLFGTNIPVCSYQVEDNKKPSAATSKSFVESEFNKDNASVEDKEKVESNQKDDDNEGQDVEKAALKKPDKLLPCPRCESMDTKFCYYNNYNVNQPRHFCKNCQRYWTAGGSLRNVPVGAGRRKNKHAISSPHYRQIRSSSASVSAALGLRTHDHESAMKMIPSPLKMQIEVADSGATVLNFGQESCGKTIPGGGDSERMEQSRDEISCSSSVTGEREAADHMNPQADGLKWPNGAVAGASPAPFFTGPWSYGWNVNVGARGTWGAMSWPLLPASPFGGWATVPWLPAPWAVAGATVSPNNNSDSGSPILGKRPQSEGPKTAEGGLQIPKTLRVEDPREAARSSVRTTLGLGNKAESTAFKAFQPKTEAEGRYDAASEVLRANPAAFSRSISFQESN